MLRDRAIAALVLAIGVAASVVILCIETVVHSGPVSAEEATVLSTVLGATVGAVATYLGGAAVGRRHPPDDDDAEADEGGP